MSPLLGFLGPFELLRITSLQSQQSAHSRSNADLKQLGSKHYTPASGSDDWVEIILSVTGVTRELDKCQVSKKTSSSLTETMSTIELGPAAFNHSNSICVGIAGGRGLKGGERTFHPTRPMSSIPLRWTYGSDRSVTVSRPMYCFLHATSFV